MGKTIKRYHYLPLLDDRNINDQGIDAAGAVTVSSKFYAFIGGALVPDTIVTDNSAGFDTALLAAAAVTAAVPARVTAVIAATYGISNGSGNLYGSSKDIGTIAAKLPLVSETGGRVNRVGFKRFEIEGTFEKFGFFDEWTEDSLNFDTDAELESHIHREMLRGAVEVTEDALQIDLLNGAGTFRFAGEATSIATVVGSDATVVDYDDLSRLSIELDNNRTPKYTKMITGTRMIDTKVLPACRLLFIGSELIPTIEKMKDTFGNPAFIPLAHYAAAGGAVANGEIGTVGHFRICVVPEMMSWVGKGADSSLNVGYRATGGKYDVYPMLTIGAESFTTIGFQTSGKMTKFKIYTKKPGEQTADRFDPYGETGFMSIKWWYGMMLLRPERIAIIYTGALK